jgi:hypothetical protein
MTINVVVGNGISGIEESSNGEETLLMARAIRTISQNQGDIQCLKVKKN